MQYVGLFLELGSRPTMEHGMQSERSNAGAKGPDLEELAAGGQVNQRFCARGHGHGWNSIQACWPRLATLSLHKETT